MIALSLLLATLLHACAFLSLRWQFERVPVRETLLRLLFVATGEDAVPVQPPPEAAPRPAAPARRSASVREARRPAPPREAAATPQPPSAPPAPAASPPRAATVESVSAPLAPEAVSARPRYKNSPEPAYPAVARRRRQEGIVLLSVRVDAAGRPEAVAIQTSSGFAALDEAAVAAVKHWEFEPGRLAGEPVPSQVEVPVQFQLDRD